MSFHQNDYLEWYIPRILPPDGSINLHSSGVPALAAEDFPPEPGDPWSAPHRLAEAIAEWQGIPADEVVFTPGATGGSLLALLTLARRDARIVVEAPIYEPMLRQASRLGPVVRLSRRHDQGWRLPLDHAMTMIGPDTGLVMITEPHNPSGRYSPREDVMALARHAARFGAVLLVNEVYRGFTAPDRPSYHGAADNIVVVSSLSKLIGTYWARLGWLSASKALIERFRAAHRNMSMPPGPAAAVGLAIMGRAEELRGRAIEVARRGLETVAPWVEATRGIEWHRPEGPGFGCLRLASEISDDLALGEHLHRQRGVLLVPGRFFEAPGTLRLSWLQSGDRLEEGLAIVADELSTRLSRGASR